MIKISVDEAYAFDMLAILQIKGIKSGDDSANLKNYAFFLTGIYNELPNGLVNAVLSSNEYHALVEANQAVFDLIDITVNQQEHNTSSNEWLVAIDVHNANMKRFYAKKALQESFFEKPLTELKTVE